MMKLNTSAPKLPYLPVKAGLLGMLLSALLMAIMLVLDGNGLIPQLTDLDKAINESSQTKTPALSPSSSSSPLTPSPSAPAIVTAPPATPPVLVDLSKLKELITANRALLNKAYAEKKKGVRLSPEVTNLADEVSQQLAEMNTLWQAYLASPLSEQEQVLAKQFTEDFEKLTKQVIKPTVDLLQLNYVNQANSLATRTQNLQSQTIKDIDAIIDAQAKAHLLELQKKAVPDTAPDTAVATTPKPDAQIAKSDANAVADASKNSAPVQKIAIITLGMLLIIAFASMVLRTLKHRLGTSPEELNQAAGHIASGHLDYRITLESGDQSSALAAIKAIQNEWKRFIVDTNILNTAINDGKLMGRRNLENHQGAFRELAQELNTTIDLALQKGQVSESSQRTLKQALQKALVEVNAIPTALIEQDLTKRIAEDSELEEISILCKTMNLLLAKMEELTLDAREHSKEIQKAAKDISQNHITLKKGVQEQAQLIESSGPKTQGQETIKQNADNAKRSRVLALSTAEIANSLSNELAQSDLPATQIESFNQVVSKIASSNQSIADMSANITAASLDQSLSLYESNNSVAQIERVSQQNIQLINDAIESSEVLLGQAEALSKSFDRLKVGTVQRQMNQLMNGSSAVSIQNQPEPEAQEVERSERVERDPDWKLF